MSITLPNGKVISCGNHCEQEHGKFKFYGIEFSGAKKLSLIVLDKSTGSIVDTYKTKMCTLEQMEMLIDRIISERKEKTYRPFGIYASAWISKAGTLIVPEKANKKPNN